ncbi:protein phosphatase 2C domain-containing protein [Henriciella sp. AS95]|uniref:PP2C family protein-serine/threonine phosphatase n=1 Tax=Henriciella sp. AS95 TaxID=3135782 RepID=UPI00317851C3
MTQHIRDERVTDTETATAFYVRGAARSHSGLVRKLNEDSYLQSPETGLWAVADGMGGHESGDVASSLIVNELSEIAGAQTAYDLRRWVARRLHWANDELVRMAASSARGSMGATVAVLTMHGTQYSCTWAGDSRIYLIRNQRLYRLTTDHSLVQALVSAGEITLSEARAHPRSNVVTRAIGANADLELETVNGEMLDGDRFLLCTDGLTNVVDEGQILSLAVNADVSAGCDALVRAALSNGAPDNVTVILTDVGKTVRR